MTRDKRVKAAYDFLLARERESQLFTLDELIQASGWKEQTVKSYLTKKWYSFVKAVEGGFECNGLMKYSKDVFIRLHKQKVPLVSDIFRPYYNNEVDALIDKAREAALLAVQIYNNPIASFRTPGFIVQMVIGYTALFHAIFLRDGIEYWYKDATGAPEVIEGDKKLWELNTCAKHYYEGTTTPETENLLIMVGLRNKIEHRQAPYLDLSISGYCQAMLTNFERLLVSEFGDYFSLSTKLVLALQFSEYSSDQLDVLHNVQGNHYEEIKKYIEDFCSSRPDTIVQHPHFCFRAFLVPKIGNHAKSSDLAIEFVHYDSTNIEEMKRYEKQVALIREKQVQVADQGKYRPTDVIREVNRRTGINMNMHVHTLAWKYYKVRQKDYSPSGCNTKYCQYSVPFRSFIYTQAWVDKLCGKLVDPVELENIKSYKEL